MYKHTLIVELLSLLFVGIVEIRAQCFFTGSCFTLYDRGISYRGHVTRSKSGKECVPWAHHLHAVSPDRFPYEGLESNYCRNPRGRMEVPWCYTVPSGKEEESWEFCDVPKCDKCLFRGVQMKNGDRFHDGCSLCICQDSDIKCLECPGPVFTDKMGCYVRFNNEEAFPKCCSKVVCHGQDPEFVLEEYFVYLKRVLHSHQQMSAVAMTTALLGNNQQRSLNHTDNTRSNLHVLP